MAFLPRSSMRHRSPSSLPVRDGVSPQALFLPAGPWPTLLAFLCERFPAVGQAQWQQRMATGGVLDSQGQPLAPEQPYQAGTRIWYYRSVAAEPKVPFEEVILHQDGHLLVVDKPHFLPVQPAGPFVRETLVARLRRRLGLDQLEPLHRLDRDTAGLVLLSTNPASRDAYHALFREHRVHKVYLAVAPRGPERAYPLDYASRIERVSGFRHHEQPGPANARTRIEQLAVRDGLALYRLQPLTGKTHQLRIHMAALGIPILNDPLYPEDRHRPANVLDSPLQLLARELRFADPISGEDRHFGSRLRLFW